MKNAVKIARRIMLLVVCHTVLMGQATELTPMLPASTAATAEVRQLILRGDLRRAEMLIPTLAGADRGLWQGVLLILRNQPARAIRVLPRSGQPKVLGVAYYLVRQHVLFREQMAEAIRTNPEDFGAYYYLARHYDSDVDNLEEALKWFRLALGRNPGFSRAQSYLGSCLERLGREPEAEVAYLASLSLPQSLAGMARLRLQTEDSSGARRYIAQAIKLDPRDASIAKLAAKIFAAAGMPGDALQALERAATLAPRDATIRYQLSRAYQLAGQAEKSAAALREFERLKDIYGTAP